MIKAKLVGDWSTARDILSQSARLKKAIHTATLLEAHNARREIVKGIRDQAPAGQAFAPLTALTLAIRRARGFRGKKILLVSGGLQRSITVKQTASGKVFVGVLRSARTKDGKSAYNIARVHEEGALYVVRVTPKMRAFLMAQLKKSGLGRTEKGRDTSGRFKKAKFKSTGGQMASGAMVIRIPARPFMAPVLERLAQDKEGLKKRFAHRIAKDMGLALGRPT